jgi:hypothetical protein
VENEWIAGNAQLWDMESDWRRLTVRLGSGSIALRLNATGEPITLLTKLWRHGSEVRLTPRGVEIASIRAGIQELGVVEGGIVVDTATGQCTLEGRPGQDMALVSESDPLIRLAMCIEALNRRQNR